MNCGNFDEEVLDKRIKSEKTKEQVKTDSSPAFIYNRVMTMYHPDILYCIFEKVR